MGVTYDLIDAPYPYLCAVYRCRCGGTATRHGDEAGAPPPGWRIHAGVNGESDDAVCPGCLERAAAADADPADRAPRETR